jgi:chitin disaccharide deacetylase
MPERRLIVNADDFGLSPGINRGILRAHSHGIVTSTSLMVRHAAAQDAVAAAREHPRLAVGLHLDLGEWEQTNGDWHSAYEVVDMEDAVAVAAEVERQLLCFRALAGCDPTHLDSHQHVHRDEPASSLIADIARSLGVPLRDRPPVSYCGAFYGQGSGGAPLPDGITADALISIIRGLPGGCTELCCHPAEDADFRSSYAAERPIELRSLCDSRLRGELEQAAVRLCSFRDVVA